MFAQPKQSINHIFRWSRIDIIFPSSLQASWRRIYHISAAARVISLFHPTPRPPTTQQKSMTRQRKFYLQNQGVSHNEWSLHYSICHRTRSMHKVVGQPHPQNIGSISIHKKRIQCNFRVALLQRLIMTQWRGRECYDNINIGSSLALGANEQ